jgi:3-phosphoglycerate kinase
VLSKKTIRDIDVKGKTVLLREDFNVALDDNGIIKDDRRIRLSLPTIEYLHSMGAKTVIIAHLGRPEGRPNPKLGLMPVATKLSDLLHLPVKFADDCIGKSAQAMVKSLQSGGVTLLENLRFNPGEETNNEEFAKSLSSLANVFVQDGFGVAYRKHASTNAITKFLPSVVGLLLEKEVNTILAVLEEPSRPLAVVIGGAKLTEKADLIDKFIDRADYLAVTGAIANAFLKADGVSVGASLVDNDSLKIAKELLHKASARMRKERFIFYLPHDVVVANKPDKTAKTRIVDISEHTWADIVSYPMRPQHSSYSVLAHEQILDIGPISAASIAGSLKMAQMVLFNGVAGMVEVEGLHGASSPFAHGTEIILEALVGEEAGTKARPNSVIVGAETVAYVESLPDICDRLNFLTTGGGASFELLAGHTMPGIDSLQPKEGGN